MMPILLQMSASSGRMWLETEDRLAHRPELFQERADLDAGAGVEARGGLVEQEDLRVVEQDPGQAEPLGHPAREAGDQRIALVGQVDQLEHLLADLLPRRALDPVGGGEEFEVLDHLHVVVDAEEVGHVADRPADVLGRGVDRVAADGRLAPGRVQERGEDAHGRRLARAVGADEAVDVPLLQAQVEAVQGVQVAVHLRQVVRLDHGACLRSGRDGETTPSAGRVWAASGTPQQFSALRAREEPSFGRASRPLPRLTAAWNCGRDWGRASAARRPSSSC
jgi:hypothetical protein